MRLGFLFKSEPKPRYPNRSNEETDMDVQLLKSDIKRVRRNINHDSHTTYIVDELSIHEELFPMSMWIVFNYLGNFIIPPPTLLSSFQSTGQQGRTGILPPPPIPHPGLRHFLEQFVHRSSDLSQQLS